MTLAAALFLVLSTTAPAPADPQEFTLEGTSLLVSDLAGAITVKGGTGDKIVVRATPGGADAAQLGFEVKNAAGSGTAELHAIYPFHKFSRFSYPHGGKSGSFGPFRSTFNLQEWRKKSDVLAKKYSAADLKGIEIGDKGGRGALEAWVDLEITLPKGAGITVLSGTGALSLSGVEGSVVLDTHRGNIVVSDVKGKTDVDTGSGSVTLSKVDGNVTIDTGSGEVEASGVQGSLSIDTGSGEVHASDVAGNLNIDTGSGGVTATSIRSQSLRIDTGSGSVEAQGVEADDLRIDTGSGDVTVSLTRLDRGNHRLDTGSGSVSVRLPDGASVRIDAETGSGGIELQNVPNTRTSHIRRNEAKIEIGEGAATMTVDTGSGRIVIK